MDKLKNLKFKLEKDNIINLFVVVLIIVDLVLLTLITFYDVNPTLTNTIINFDVFVCFVLFCEFIYRIRKEDDKIRFLKHNWTDIIAMIPLDFLFLRVFRLVRLIRVIRLLRVIRVLAMFKKELRHVREFFKQTHLDLALGILLFAIFAGTIIFFLLEIGRGNVSSFADSLWLAITTTMVGGADVYPTTIYGRIVATILMIIGITFVGLLTASVASWFVKKTDVETEKDIQNDLDQIKVSITKLQEDLDDLKELIKNKK